MSWNTILYQNICRFPLPCSILFFVYQTRFICDTETKPPTSLSRKASFDSINNKSQETCKSNVSGIDERMDFETTTFKRSHSIEDDEQGYISWSQGTSSSNTSNQSCLTNSPGCVQVDDEWYPAEGESIIPSGCFSDLTSYLRWLCHWNWNRYLSNGRNQGFHVHAFICSSCSWWVCTIL